MLIREIERNPATEPEKQLDRVYWIFRKLGVRGDSPGPGRQFSDFLQSKDMAKKPGKGGPAPEQDNPDYVVHLSGKPEK